MSKVSDYRIHNTGVRFSAEALLFPHHHRVLPGPTQPPVSGYREQSWQTLKPIT